MASYATQASAYPVAPSAPSLLAEISGGYANHLGDLHNLSMRLHRLADRVIGSRPEAVGKDAANPPDGSLIQTFKRNQNELQDVLGSVRDAVERLEAL